MIQKWKQVSSEVLYDYRIFKMRQHKRVSPRTGREHTFFGLESPDWVNIIALTAAQNVVMIRQYRQGNGQITLEIPGGMVDPGEEPLVAALRELREETGYAGAPETAIKLGTVSPNPAVFDNTCHSFFLPLVEKVGELALDGAEDIEVEEVPLVDVPQLILAGEIDHSIMMNAFYLLDLRRKAGLL